MNDLTINKYMTVKEVAEVLKVSDDVVRRRVLELFPYLIKNGKSTYLDEVEVTAIKMRIEQNSRLIPSKQNRDTFAQTQSSNISNAPKTELEKELLIQQAMQFQAEKINSLKGIIVEKDNQLLEQKPAVDFYKAVTGSKDAIPMSQAAKILDMGIGRNKLFEILRENKILRYNNEPFQKYIDIGYFRIVEQKYSHHGETKISIKTLVYQKGLDYIRKILEKR